jgi:hypothetical protein
MMKNLAAALLAASAGCATAQTDDGAFHLTGRLDSKQVTHVVASNPVNASRVVVEVLRDGSFDLVLPTGSSWVVTLTDWTKVGKDMQVATLQVNGLDAFAPQTAGMLDMGDVKLSGARAHGTTTWGEVIGALGLDAATAIGMARNDDLALRYANPDIDNDGVIDALQHGHEYKLEISGAFTLENDDRAVTIDDLVAGTYANPSVSYTGTTIQAIVPSAMNMQMHGGTLTFEQPFFGVGHTPMVEAGTPVGAPHVKFGQLDGHPTMGVVARAGERAPRGVYELGFANGQLTFSDVLVPSQASLESTPDYAVPFVRLQPIDATCTTSCDIAAIDVAWRALGETGWQELDERHAARVDLVAVINGKRTTLGANLDGVSSLDWTKLPVANTGISTTELARIQTSGICYLAVTYASASGMKMTMSVANPACY